MELQRTLGANILRFRQKKGWSQENLAEKSGLHRTYISQIETGVRNPTLLILQRIATAFEVLPYELLKDHEESVA